MTSSAPGTGDAVPIVLSEAHRAHDPEFELERGRRISPIHERPQRLDAIGSALLDDGHRAVPATHHGDGHLLTVHDEGMIAFLRTGYEAWRRAGGPAVMIPDTFRSPCWNGGGRQSASALAQAGWWCFDTATPVVAGSYQAARGAVDIALTAADLVAAGTPLAYGLTRPPGHHAGRDYFGGFCYLNHAAAAARRLTDGGRVAVLDVDVHHGNGTQDIFWRDAGVLYVSLHADPDHAFPHFSGFDDEHGAGPGRGTTRNLPLPRGTGDQRYLDALTMACEVVDEFDPAAVIVSLGFDTSEHDPIGSLAVTTEGFRAMGERLAGLERPTLVLQEGGYAVDHLGELATALFRGMARSTG